MRELEGAVVLVVRDIESAARWYRYVFKFHVESERVGLNGVPIEATLRRASGLRLVLMSTQRGASALPRQHVLRLVVPDSLDDLAERAVALDDGASAPVLQATELGRQLRLCDPDGHTLIVLNAGASDRG